MIDGQYRSEDQKTKRAPDITCRGKHSRSKANCLAGQMATQNKLGESQLSMWKVDLGKAGVVGGMWNDK